MCYVPDTDNKSVCTFNFAAYTNGYIQIQYIHVLISPSHTGLTTMLRPKNVGIVGKS